MTKNEFWAMIRLALACVAIALACKACDVLDSLPPEKLVPKQLSPTP